MSTINTSGHFARGTDVSIPVSYTHLDVYKRQVLLYITVRSYNRNNNENNNNHHRRRLRHHRHYGG